MSFLATFPLVLSAQKGVSPCPVILLLSLNSPSHPSHSITVTTDLLSSKMSFQGLRRTTFWSAATARISGYEFAWDPWWIHSCRNAPESVSMKSRFLEIYCHFQRLSVKLRSEFHISVLCTRITCHSHSAFCQGDLRMLGEPNKASVSIAWHIGILLSTIFHPYLILWKIQLGVITTTFRPG